MNGPEASSLGLYVHIPYCIKKCPYCDFNSYSIVGESPVRMPEEDYAKALLQELKHLVAVRGLHGRKLHSIFFGGGTPSLFSAESIGAVIRQSRECFEFLTDIEITLEANPGTIQEALGMEKLSEFRAAGVNRISMGVQGFSEKKLKALGRIHSREDVFSAVENIQQAGFSNFNLDMIFGVDDETLVDWLADLSEILRFQPKHISAYCLTIEPGTEFARLQSRGKLRTPHDDVTAEMYRSTQAMLEKDGYEQYEISNYARPGFSCRHNLGYWRGEDYLGLGAGAHSFFRMMGSAAYGYRTANIPGPKHYLERVFQQGEAVQKDELLEKEAAEAEFFFLGLRTTSGISPTEYEARFTESFFSRFQVVVETYIQKGLLKEVGSRICLTSEGFLFADELMSEFLVCEEKSG